MLKILITVLFFVLNTISLKAEIVKDVKISGNTRVSEETIKIYGGIKINEDYNEQQLNKVINNLLKL